MSETREIFATRQGAVDDALTAYALEDVRFSGSDASGWTYTYHPKGWQSVETESDAEMAPADALESAMPVVVTIDSFATEELNEAIEVDGQEASESSPMVPAEAPELYYVSLAALLPLGLAEEMRARIERSTKSPCDVRRHGDNVVMPRAEKPRKATASASSGDVCKVDGLTWSVEFAGETNIKQAESMKARIDALVSARDLDGLKALKWAGCPDHENPKGGNTYSRQGGQYRANWIEALPAIIARERAEYGC